jgi:hypothetical protein
MRNQLLRFAIIALAGLSPTSDLWGDDPVKFVAPTDEASQMRVSRASDWLVRHLVRGTLSEAPQLGPLTLVAWHDPTLAPNDSRALAAYAITDSLWASRALALHHPAHAAAMTESLSKLDCVRNNLHEVLFEPLHEIHHRSADEDIVHGRLLGTFETNGRSILVRTFRMRADAEYAKGHPALFAEHAVYQALYEFRRGEAAVAHNRLAAVFESPAPGQNVIRWDRARGVLVDYVNAEEYRRFVAREAATCRQYAFKLALLIYAVRLMDLEGVDEAVVLQMRERLWAAQLESGGVPHYYDVSAAGQCLSCPDATGEATAIGILSETVAPARLR